jgi:hypothetical protein
MPSATFVVAFFIACCSAATKALADAAIPNRLPPVRCSGGYAMGLTRPFNALVICAAFTFIGALIIGVVP